MKNILITAESDEAFLLLNNLSSAGLEPIHLPLEKYMYSTDRDQHETVVERLDSFRFVVYGGLRNTRYFLNWMEQSGMIEEFQQKIHLVMNQPESDLLESAGVPAIMPVDGGRPIDIMEFLLRISINGIVLYPCAEESSEEMPGLLEELEMPVVEFTVCRTVPFKKKAVEKKRIQLQNKRPDAILFHSRGSVIRTKAAFPDLDLGSRTLIAASAGVAHKIKQEGLEPTFVANGSWKSVEKLLIDRV